MLIETTGLADPVPILQALMTDPAIFASHQIDTLVTVVDPVHGADSLDRFAEARAQVALADLLVVSKTDLGAPGAALLASIAALNPAAERVESQRLSPERVFMGGDKMARAARLAMGPVAASASHTAGIATRSLRRAGAMPALALTMWLQALAEHCGERLLRMKGMVSIAEMPGQPAVVHGVRHVFAAPEFLDRWPSDDQDTRLVFISQDMPEHFPARLLDAIEAEVSEELSAAREAEQGA